MSFIKVNGKVSLDNLYLLFRDHFEVGTKSGKYKIDSK